MAGKGKSSGGSARSAKTGRYVTPKYAKAHPSTTVTDAPGLKDPYELTVNVLASRTYPAFRQAVVVAEILPPSLMGDYHLAGTSSPAYGRGSQGTTVRWGAAPSGWTYAVSSPAVDIDGDKRPSLSPTRYDAGSDQLTP